MLHRIKVNKIKFWKVFFMGEEPVFFRAKELSVNTWRSGPDICSLICGVNTWFRQQSSLAASRLYFHSFWCIKLRMMYKKYMIFITIPTELRSNMPGQKINLNCTRKLLILTYRARSLFGSLFGDAVFLVVVIWQLLAMNDGTTLVWPDLFFCKELSLVVNKQDQRTMKTTIKVFLAVLELNVKNWAHF